MGRWGSGVLFRVLSYFVMLCRLNQFLFFQVMPTMHLQIDFLILKCSYMHAWGSRNIANHSINQYFYWNLTNSSLQFSVSPFCPKSLIVLHLLLDEHEPPELLACICRSSLKGFQGVIYQKWRRGSKLLLSYAYYIPWGGSVVWLSLIPRCTMIDMLLVISLIIFFEDWHVVIQLYIWCRYLVPCDMLVGQFIFILRSRLHLSPGTALFVFVNNTLPQTGETAFAHIICYSDPCRSLRHFVPQLGCS